MENTILFFTSELNSSFAPANCNDLYKIIDRHLTVNRTKPYFNLFKYDQPSGEEVLNKIAENPGYIQYCGHGGEEGDLQLIDAQGKVHSLSIESLEKQLKKNFNLECLFLGSCNSDKLLDRLMEYAEYSIGFTHSPKADFVNAFYDRFYARLAFHGSTYKAFLEARDRLNVNRTLTAGSQVIFRSKNTVIMELMELEDSSLLAKSKLKTTDQRLSDRVKKLASLKEQADDITEKLLRDHHPFAAEITAFSTLKKKIAHDLTTQVLANEGQLESERFERMFLLALNVIQDVMVAFEERKIAKTSLTEIGKRLPKKAAARAFQFILNRNDIKEMGPEFQKWFTDSVNFCAKIILRA